MAPKVFRPRGTDPGVIMLLVLAHRIVTRSRGGKDLVLSKGLRFSTGNVTGAVKRSRSSQNRKASEEMAEAGRKSWQKSDDSDLESWGQKLRHDD